MIFPPILSDISRSTAYRIIEKDDHLKSCDVHILARNMNTLQVEYCANCNAYTVRPIFSNLLPCP